MNVLSITQVKDRTFTVFKNIYGYVKSLLLGIVRSIPRLVILTTTHLAAIFIGIALGAHLILTQGIALGRMMTSVGMQVVAAATPVVVEEMQPVAWMTDNPKDIDPKIQNEIIKRTRKSR